jgi:DNA-binding NarL/FixJ family response regulator
MDAATANAAGAIRVVVADDHTPTRTGVRIALARAGMAVCAEAADAASAVEAALREHPDLCLIEPRLPGGGVAAAREIVRKLPGTAVVMFASSADDDELFDSLRAGAHGYLPKDIDPEHLVNALRGVLDGEAALPRRLVARVLDEFRTRGQRRFRNASGRRVDLTPRELEVLELMRAGLTTNDIAARLFISNATVRTHIAAVLHKLEAPDRASALRLAADR